MLVRSLLSSQTLRTPQTFSLTTIFRYSQTTKHPLLNSRFFMQGPRTTSSNKPISKLFNTTLGQIQKLQALLQEKGQKVLKNYRQEQLSIQLNARSQKKQIKEYLQAYRSLIQALQKSKLQNQQAYNIIGWYNIVSLKRTLVEKLFSAQYKELSQLIEALSWMKGKQASIEEFFQSREEYLDKCRKFYRKLPLQMKLSDIKKIDDILNPSSYLEQRRFYQAYLRMNLENILTDTNSSRDDQLAEDVIWLLETSVKAMNDSEICIGKMEKFILNWKPKVSPQSIQKLINAYSQLGRNNRLMYQTYLKQYLQVKSQQPQGAFFVLKYLICSRTQDKVLFKSCLQKIEAGFSSQAFSQLDLSQLHTYLHYLLISGERTKISKKLDSSMHHNCRKQNCISSINQIILNLKANKISLSKFKKNNQRYISQCLQNKKSTKIQKLDNFEKDEFKEEFGIQMAGINFSELDIYKNVSFCNFKLEYFVHNKVKNEVINLESQCEPYVFNSGQLKRQTSMRDQILQYYGIKVNHINAHKFQTKPRKLSQDDQMMSRKVKRPKF